MVIKKDGWICQIAYGYPPNRPIPKELSLCKLFQRTLFWTFVMWPLIIALIVVTIIVGVPVSFLFGHRMTFKEKVDLFTPIPILSKFKPIYFIGIPFAMWWIYHSIMVVSQDGILMENHESWQTFLPKFTVVFLVIGSLYGIILSLFMTSCKVRWTQFPKLTLAMDLLKAHLKARLKACKNKFRCPIVEIK